MGGSFHTVSPYKYNFFNPDEIVHGSSHRSIYDLSNWDGCISVIPTGISGICGSKFYCDQTTLYVKGDYHADPFSDEDVREKAVYTMVFSPR